VSLEDIVKVIKDEWPVISGAPWSFAAAVVAVGLLIWLAVKTSYAVRFASLQSRIDLKNDQIADYKAKLGDAPPETIRKKIKSLEDAVVAMKPRELADAERQAISVTCGASGTLRIHYMESVADAEHYASGFFHAFTRAGWQVSVIAAVGVTDRPPTGLRMYVQEAAKLTSRQEMVINALKSAGVPFDLGARSDIGASVDVLLLITRPAQDSTS
jgi:hypothetical protein